MKEGITYSGRLASLCGVTLGAAILMAWLRQDLALRQTLKLRVAGKLEADLGRQIAANSDYEKSNLEALRTRVDRFQYFLGSENTWKEIIQQFGKSWRCEAGTKSDRDGYSVQMGTFELLSPALSDWSKTIEVIGTTESLPGVGIANFEMKTSGNSEHRSVDFVRIVVEVHSRRLGSILGKP
jgi:hypothetical protein